MLGASISWHWLIRSCHFPSIVFYVCCEIFYFPNPIAYNLNNRQIYLFAIIPFFTEKLRPRGEWCSTMQVVYDWESD